MEELRKSYSRITENFLLASQLLVNILILYFRINFENKT